MKTRIAKIASFMLALAFVLYGQVQAPTFTTTSLSAAITAGQNVITVASATGFTARTTILSVDNELMGVQAVSGLNITVSRGVSGTRATRHGNGRAVKVGAPVNFQSCQGGSGLGQCGWLFTNQLASGPGSFGTYPATVATATTVTLTAGQVLGGLILEDPAGGAVTATLPTAVLMIQAVPGATVGTSFYFTVRNTADASETITVAGGTGGTISGTATIAQSNSKLFLFRFTAVDSGNEAYTVYSVGTFVH